MDKNKVTRIAIGVFIVLGLVVIWVCTYNICMNTAPKNAEITKEDVENFDESRYIFKDADITVGKKTYKLKDLNKDVIKDNVVVTVKVNNREVQGYVVYSDILTEPQVKLADDDKYAQIMLPEKGEK